MCRSRSLLDLRIDPGRDLRCQSCYETLIEQAIAFMLFPIISPNVHRHKIY
jgi:hypothetical protein